MKKYYQYWIAFIVIFGLLITTIIYREVKQAQDTAFQKEFMAKANNLSSFIVQEIKLNLEVLQFFKSFYDSSQTVSGEEFSQFSRHALYRHASIHAIEWSPKVLHADREKVEQAHKNRVPGFQFTERSPGGNMVRAKEREVYYPVLFIEPLAGNEPALGFDLASDESRRDGLVRAGESGQLTLTAGIDLVQNKRDGKGFLAFLPIYKTGGKSGSGRYDKLTGFVLGVFSIEEIVVSAIKKRGGTDILGIRIEIRDFTDDRQGKFLYSNDNIKTDSPSSASVAYREQLISVGGRDWGVSAFPTKSYVDEHKKTTAEWVLIVGVSFTLFVFVYLLLIVKNTRQIQLLVDERTRELYAANKKMELLSMTDALTGVLNRRGFDQAFEAEFQHAIRDNSMITLFLIDVDQFKLYNDHYGHLDGDECLKQVAASIASVPSRYNDVVARYGGEEFAVILPGTDDAQGAIAERCRAAVEQLGIIHHYSPVSSVVTVSIGVATMEPDQESDPVELVGRADKALFQAKKTGRNRVVVG